MKIFILCPLSQEQKPINEYLRFKKNQTINWTMNSRKLYTNYLILLYRNIFGFLFSGACFSATPCFFMTRFCFEATVNVWNSVVSSLPFPFPKTKLGEILVDMNEISLLIFLTIFGLFFFFWADLSKGLKKSYLLYEEGSWYEIQRWEKPLFLIKNDRLINNKRLQRIKKRMYYTVGLSWVLEFLFVKI